MKHRFRPYLNPVFIETGSYGGDGIVAAKKAGFKRIFSIELSDYYYNLCVERYNKFRNVYLYHGDSIEVLPRILKIINERCTFWLDAHFCGDVTGKGQKPVPLMEELEIIKNHHIKDHTILVDDMRLLRDEDSEWHKEMGVTYNTNDIETFIKSINSAYCFTYIRGTFKKDILVARIL